MKFLIVFATILAIASAERYIPNAEDPNLPGNCLFKDLKLSIPKGDTVHPVNVGQCYELVCQNDLTIRVNECGRYNLHEGCKFFPTDYTKTFPDCCAHIKCY